MRPIAWLLKTLAIIAMCSLAGCIVTPIGDRDGHYDHDHFDRYHYDRDH